MEGEGLNKLEILLKETVQEFELGEEFLKKQKIWQAVPLW